MNSPEDLLWIIGQEFMLLNRKKFDYWITLDPPIRSEISLSSILEH